jgi:hypothetical protein
LTLHARKFIARWKDNVQINGEQAGRRAEVKRIGECTSEFAFILKEDLLSDILLPVYSDVMLFALGGTLSTDRSKRL